MIAENNSWLGYCDNFMIPQTEACQASDLPDKLKRCRAREAQSEPTPHPKRIKLCFSCDLSPIKKSLEKILLNKKNSTIFQELSPLSTQLISTNTSSVDDTAVHISSSEENDSFDAVSGEKSAHVSYLKQRKDEDIVPQIKIIPNIKCTPPPPLLPIAQKVSIADIEQSSYEDETFEILIRKRYRSPKEACFNATEKESLPSSIQRLQHSPLPEIFSVWPGKPATNIIEIDYLNPCSDKDSMEWHSNQKPLFIKEVLNLFYETFTCDQDHVDDVWQEIVNNDAIQYGEQELEEMSLDRLCRLFDQMIGFFSETGNLTISKEYKKIFKRLPPPKIDTSHWTEMSNLETSLKSYKWHNRLEQSKLN